jgi:uncharacterized membrane protein YphA (DoxX/SURF4 family)
MDVVAWVLRVVVGVVFVLHGVLFAWPPPRVRERIRDEMPITPLQTRLLGVAEVLGGVALVVLPAADVARPLAYGAAAGIAVVLTGATILHLRRREVLTTMGTVLLLIALAIAVVATPS